MSSSNDSVKENKVVLVIDDEEMLLKLSQQFLEMSGIHTVGFSNSQLALEWFEHNHQNVSLTILDLKMSGLDGKGCFDKMLQLDKNSKIAFLTGLAEPEIEEQLLKKGAVAFLKKPLKYPDLVEWVQNQLIIK